MTSSFKRNEMDNDAKSDVPSSSLSGSLRGERQSHLFDRRHFILVAVVQASPVLVRLRFRSELGESEALHSDAVRE